MAWKLYIQFNGCTSIKVPGSFKTEEDAQLFYRRNKDLFEDKDGINGKPVYVETGKGRGKK